MSTTNQLAHKQGKSELDQFEIFYEHINDSRPSKRNHTKLTRPR